jgi:hypothetical protein
MYDRASRTVHCIECPTEPTEGGPTDLPEIDSGVAGSSAQREFERRKANREARIKGRFGDRVGGWITALTDEPQSTRAWARGPAASASSIKRRLKDAGSRRDVSPAARTIASRMSLGLRSPAAGTDVLQRACGVLEDLFLRRRRASRCRLQHLPGSIAVGLPGRLATHAQHRTVGLPRGAVPLGRRDQPDPLEGELPHLDFKIAEPGEVVGGSSIHGVRLT